MIYRIIARILAIPTVTQWIIDRAKRTPYAHIKSADGRETYMYRWWLFNPYGEGLGRYEPRYSWLPSIRVHHICRQDQDRHLHDHPWNARTFILRGHYFEHVGGQPFVRMRKRGDTASIPHNLFHRIVAVPEGGVWTLFVTGRYRHKWGFKISHTEYLAREKK